MKVTANGKTFTFPEGTSVEDVSSAIDEYFSAQPQQAQQQPAPVSNVPAAPSMPAYTPKVERQIDMPEKLPFGMKPEDIRSANKAIEERNLYEQSFVDRPDLQQLRKQEAQRGTMSAIGQGLKHTLQRFSEGGSELIDKYAPESLANLLNYQPFADEQISSPDARMKDRAERMAQERERYRVVSGESPIATTVGETLPYIATGEVLGAGIGAAGKVAQPMLSRASMPVLERIAPNEVARMLAKPKIPSDFSRRAVEFSKAPAIGAAEGGLQYDSSIKEGALASTLGATSGLLGPLSFLNRVENVHDKNTKALVKEMHKEGFSLTPGMRTGNRQMQKEEAGMRNSDVLGDYFYEKVDRPNERKMTELAGDAIGLDGKNRDSFSPQELSDHMQALRNQYGELEANTTGRFTPDAYSRLSDVLKNLRPSPTRNTTQAAKQRFALVNDIFNDMRRDMQFVTRDTATGKFKAATFDGAQYQRMSQRIKDEIQTALNNGDQVTYKNLTKIKSELDDALTAGMSKTTVGQWKDLNERYAMTNMLMESGMTPSGRVDPTGLTSAVMKKGEAQRTLTGSGGRIKKFQKIARYNDVLNNVEGGSLTGLGGADFMASRDLGKLPFRYKLPMYARATGAYRLSRAPTWGFGPNAALKTGRAIGASGPLENLADSGSESFEKLMAMLGGNNGN